MLVCASGQLANYFLLVWLHNKIFHANPCHSPILLQMPGGILVTLQPHNDTDATQHFAIAQHEICRSQADES